MRHAHQDVFFHMVEGKPVGISLGYDWCAEHEHGISRLKDLLGVKSPEFPMGVEDRLAKPSKEACENIRFDTFSCRMPSAPGSEKKTFKLEGARLWVSSELTSSWALHSTHFQESLKAPKKPFMAHMFGRSKDHDKLKVDGFHEMSKESMHSDYLMQSEWGQEGFKVTVWGKERVKALTQMHQALINGELTVSTGSSPNPFGRGGLHLMLACALPLDYKESVLANDKDYKEMTLAVRATGIEDEIKKAGKGFYALAPRYFDVDGVKTLKFFLNPREQNKYKSGWFTLTELREWIKEQGPVIKKKETAQ